jgi:hypothetical protein
VKSQVAKTQEKAGAFDMLLCTGSFFAADGSADETWEKVVAGTEKGKQPSIRVATRHSVGISGTAACANSSRVLPGP